MEPKYIWGPRKWNELHRKALNFYPCQAKDFLLWLRMFLLKLPCPECQIHFAKLLLSNPVEPYLTNRETLFYWTYIIHDQVNARLGKYSPPYAIAKSIYY